MIHDVTHCIYYALYEVLCSQALLFIYTETFGFFGQLEDFTDVLAGLN